LRRLILTGLGTGLLPGAPGTWASAGVAGVFVLVAWASGGDAWVTAAAMGGVAAFFSAACAAWGGLAERAYGKKDPRQVTADEWAGQAVAYILLPLGSGWRDWLIAAGAGFAAFRLLDILKPAPARASERYGGGWGILSDDLIAGVYSNLSCQVLIWAGRTTWAIWQSCPSPGA
jgi:phosphatidylglycerophosphatase A